MSTLELDRTDAGIDSMVAGWKDGGVYEVRMKIRQVSSDLKSAKFEPTEVVDETVEAEPEGAFPAEKPKMGKPSIVISK